MVNAISLPTVRQNMRTRPSQLIYTCFDALRPDAYTGLSDDESLCRNLKKNLCVLLYKCRVNKPNDLSS